jgi:proteasome accessory factor B
LTADEPSFDVFWEATLTRRPVTFDYRRPGYPEPLTRHLEPWGVVRYSGRWYVVGQDTDRREERVFRLSRVVGQATMTGPAGSFVVPPGTDVRDAARRLGPAVPAEEAVVLVRPGTAAVLRRTATSLEPDVAGPDEETPWDRLRLSGAQADELLAFGPDLYVEGPATLRDEVVARLRAGVSVAS